MGSRVPINAVFNDRVLEERVPVPSFSFKEVNRKERSLRTKGNVIPRLEIAFQAPVLRPRLSRIGTAHRVVAMSV